MGTFISIIIPSYSRSHLIVEAIHTNQNQSYENWECIIVDDWSIDNSEKIINNFIETDSRIQKHKKSQHFKKGAYAARNHGFTNSNGVYIKFSQNCGKRCQITAILKIMIANYYYNLQSAFYKSYKSFDAF